MVKIKKISFSERLIPKKVTVKKIKGGYVIKLGRKNFDETNQKSSALFKAQQLRISQAELNLRLLKKKFMKS